MEFMNGKMDGSTKEIFKMIIEMDMVNFMIKKGQFLREFGKMESKHLLEDRKELEDITKILYQVFNLVESVLVKEEGLKISIGTMRLSI